jgi:hypothetical protein
MAVNEVKVGKCPSCEDENVLIQVDPESGQVIINNIEQAGEWKEREGKVKVFVGTCGSPLKPFSNESKNYCEQLIKINWYSNGEMIACYVPMGRHTYTSHGFSGPMASSENLGGRNSIFLSTEIDGGRVLEEDTWVENMTGRVQMDMDIPAEVLGKVKIVPDMGAYMTSALEPLNGAVAIAGAKMLLEPVAEDMIGICDIKCESNPEGGNDEGRDYDIYKRLEAVMAELTAISAEFVSVNNEEGE